MKRLLICLLLIVLLCGCNQKQVKMVKYCENGTPVYDENKTDIVKCEIVTTARPLRIECEDEDFTYNEESKKCENILSIPANRRLGCKDEEKYELKNGACYPKKGVKGGVKYKINIYSCPESGTLNGKNCEFIDEHDPVIECPKGYEVNLKIAKCDKKTYEEFKEREE